MEIRLALPADGGSLAGIYGPAVTDSATSFEEEPPDAAEMTRRVVNTLPRHPWLVAVQLGEVLGYSYGGIHRSRPAYRWTAEVSVYVRSDHQRKGIGRTLYAALFRVLTLQGYRQAVAGITLPNLSSVGLHESMGFRPVGIYRQVGWKMGTWHDVGWWQCPLAGSSGNPDEPRPITEVDPAALRAVLTG